MAGRGAYTGAPWAELICHHRGIDIIPMTESIEETLQHWPDPEPHQVEVLLLGTTHLDNPGLDEVNPEVGEVLEPDRQRELGALVDRLESAAPDRVAVERPWDRHDELDEQYQAYRTGEWAYDTEARVESVHPKRNDPTTECRSEVVQIGFRLADRLDHETVYPVDDPMDLTNDDAEELQEVGFSPEEKVPIDLPDPERKEEADEERFATSTISEYLLAINRAAEQQFNHRFMFAEAIPWGRGENFGGPDQLATWYRRNLHIVHNCWRSLEPGDQRLFLLVGNGHVRVLRQLLDETPQFCPVSPLPYLAG